ncbi:MAG: hypothetical protein FGM14_15050 [Flavobacteriales bacterium]|nr:hypothetical protein [Flavobacteriales bacterium]
MKTHFKKLKDPNYIGSWDLMDENGTVQNRIVTIKEVKQDVVFDGKGGSEQCPVVLFNECKPMVANSTNLKAIQKVTGSPFIEDWVGKQIELTVVKVKAFGEIHDAIRVVPKAPQLQQKAKESISDERFEDALKSIKDGKFTKEKLQAKYILTSTQKLKLNEI